VFARTVRVVYRPDGGVSVIHPAKEGHASIDFDRTMDRDPDLKGLPYDDIDHLDLPDRENRDCWTQKAGGGVKVDAIKKADKKAKKLAKENKKKSAEQKLKGLGLTKEEIDLIL